MIVGSHDQPLDGIMRDMKAFTSRTLNDMIRKHPQESRKEWMLPIMEKAGKENPNNYDFQLWQQEYHPIQLMTAGMTQQKLDHIHENPVKAGLVAEAQHYVYSSAADYAGQTGLIRIVQLF